MAGAASYFVYRGIQNVPVREVEAPTDPVVVAAKPLTAGALLGPGDVKLAAWPKKSPIAGAFRTTNPVIGLGLLTAVAENEPITSGKLASRESGAGLAVTIPPGMRAVSVKVNEVVGVAGFVVPGSHVDVLVTVDLKGETTTRSVVSNLRVLAAGTRYDQPEAKDAKPIPTTVVTLLVTPEDAERVTLASSAGTILLALRNLLDTAPTTTSGSRLASLMTPVAPSSSQSPPVETTYRPRKAVVAAAPLPPLPPTPLPYTVETIRGAKRAIEEVKK
jgi:pilus assembly protein CpaB